MSAGLTSRLRVLSCALWSLGLAVLAFDFLALPVLHWKASASYLLFGSALALTAWAELREFGARVALYRVHDATIFSPWRFLLLYFLWVSLFAPFTRDPLASLVYAANGWFSLAAVGLAGQFIFSERTIHGVVLVPDRLALAFWCYCASVGFLLLNSLARLAFPQALPMLMNEQANLFLHFTIGLPFLLWDFLKEGRRLVPRLLSGLTLGLGCVTTLLLNQRFYLLAVALSLGSVLLLFVYKRIRLRRILLLAGFLSGWGIAAGLAIYIALEHSGLLGVLEAERGALAERMHGSFSVVLEALRSSRGIGEGVGIPAVRGVWTRVIAEAGVVGIVLYLGFFVNVLRDLFQVRRSSRVVVSNVSFVSLSIFLVLVAHHVENPYGAYVWVWYALWALFASTARKRRAA